MSDEKINARDMTKPSKDNWEEGLNDEYRNEPSIIDKLRKEIGRLQAENEGLRAALDEVVLSWDSHCCEPVEEWLAKEMRPAIDEARKVLNHAQDANDAERKL